MLKKSILALSLVAFGAGVAAQAHTTPKAHDRTPQVKDRSAHPRGVRAPSRS